MKYLYFAFLLILAALSLSNYSRISKAKAKIEKQHNDLNQILTESGNYLTSLTSQPHNYVSSKILLVSNDTLNLLDSNVKGLFYIFSQNDCVTCIEENIFTLIDYTKKASTQNVYIISTKENIRYLKLLAKVYRYNSLNFGWLMNSVDIPASCYFKKYDNGMISNTYYPIKGEFACTKKYLDKMNTISD
ncbi:hypothetical protein [Gaoshiqia sp. Z1-71]|uniref:hypothetical protein n=1 Tax=Gaoshiqia hydrogeniformans TaxID=3290090 RepID=UPI003BF8D509